MMRFPAAFAMVLCTALLLTGCQAMGEPAAFDADGIPHERYYVGGGLRIKYTAPVDGTAYFVDNNLPKIIMTESLEKGEAFSISGGATEPEEYQQMMGAPIKDAKLALYFVPNESSPPPAE